MPAEVAREIYTTVNISPETLISVHFFKEEEELECYLDLISKQGHREQTRIISEPNF